MRVAILGLGLIGGSIARALHEQPGGDWSVAAWTPGGTAPAEAMAAGVIAEAAARPEDAVRGAGLVVLAAPPDDCLALTRDLAGPLAAALAPDAVVTDVASTKAAIVALAASLGLRFVGGHPMAGLEATGYARSDAGLFRGRRWVIVPGPDAAAISRVEALAGACGARTLWMSADEHDAVVAAISHLPLVVSAALVEAVAGTPDNPREDWELASRLAATGWAGMTRLARGSVEMGTGIATTNAPAIAARLRDLRAVLDEWIALLEAEGGPDVAGVRQHLADARAVLHAGLD